MSLTDTLKRTFFLAGPLGSLALGFLLKQLFKTGLLLWFVEGKRFVGSPASLSLVWLSLVIRYDWVGGAVEGSEEVRCFAHTSWWSTCSSCVFSASSYVLNTSMCVIFYPNTTLVIEPIDITFYLDVLILRNIQTRDGHTWRYLIGWIVRWNITLVTCSPVIFHSLTQICIFRCEYSIDRWWRVSLLFVLSSSALLRIDGKV